MSQLALGTVQFGLPYGIANRAGQVTRSEAKAMLQLAAIKSIDTLDTAISYGDSELVWANLVRKISRWLPNCQPCPMIAKM